MMPVPKRRKSWLVIWTKGKAVHAFRLSLLMCLYYTRTPVLFQEAKMHLFIRFGYWKAGNYISFRAGIF